MFYISSQNYTTLGKLFFFLAFLRYNSHKFTHKMYPLKSCNLCFKYVHRVLQSSHYLSLDFHHPKKKPCALQQSFSIPPSPQIQPWTSTDLLSVSIDLPIWTFHINGMYQSLRAPIIDHHTRQLKQQKLIFSQGWKAKISVTSALVSFGFSFPGLQVTLLSPHVASWCVYLCRQRILWCLFLFL